jgi:hypothetical protein
MGQIQALLVRNLDRAQLIARKLWSGPVRLQRVLE